MLSPLFSKPYLMNLVLDTKRNIIKGMNERELDRLYTRDLTEAEFMYNIENKYIPDLNYINA